MEAVQLAALRASGHEDVSLFPTLRHVDGASAVSAHQIGGFDQEPWSGVIRMGEHGNDEGNDEWFSG